MSRLLGLEKVQVSSGYCQMSSPNRVNKPKNQLQTITSPRFVDAEFPPSVHSLSRNPKSQLSRYLTFLPISSHPSLHSIPLINPYNYTLDYNSNTLQHHYFLDVLRVIALYPHLLDRIFVRKSAESSDIYNVLLCDTGEWRLLHLDEYVLVEKKSKRPAFITTSNGVFQELWPFILEKAFAKCIGAYDLLSAGCYEHMMRDLTGACYQKFGEDLTNRELQTFLENSIKKKDIVTCFLRENFSDNKSQPFHLITEIIKDNKQNRNATAKFSLKNLSDQKQDQEIILSIHELREKYHDFCSVQLRESYKYASVRVRHDSETQHTALKLVLPKPMEVFVSVNQKDARCFVPKTSAEFNYYEEPNPIFKVETLDLTQNTLNTSLELSSISHSHIQSRIDGNLEDFIYTYSPVRLIIAQLMPDMSLKFVDGTLSRARNTQLTLNLEEGTYIILTEMHWAQELYKDFTISFYSEEKLAIHGYQELDLEVFLNTLIKDLVEISWDDRVGQKGESETQDYDEAGCADIVRSVGMTAGLMWFYYKNESKTHTLVEDIELLIKNLIIIPSDAFRAVEESPMEARAEEEETNLQIVLGPNSEKFILFKLIDLEYLCKYKLVSQVRLSTQTTPRGKPPRYSKLLVKTPSQMPNEEVFGKLEDLPVNDLYNDVIESNNQRKKDKRPPEILLQKFNEADEIKEYHRNNYKNKRTGLGIQDLGVNDEEDRETIGTFGRLETHSSEDIDRAHFFGTQSPKFNNAVRTYPSPKNVREDGGTLGLLRKKLVEINNNPDMSYKSLNEEQESALEENSWIDNDGNVAFLNELENRKRLLNNPAATAEGKENSSNKKKYFGGKSQNNNPKEYEERKTESGEQCDDIEDRLHHQSFSSSLEHSISAKDGGSTFRSPFKSKESIKDTLVRVLSERKRKSGLVTSDSPIRIEQGGSASSLNYTRETSPPKTTKRRGSLRKSTNHDDITLNGTESFYRGAYILFTVLLCRSVSNKQAALSQLVTNCAINQRKYKNYLYLAQVLSKTLSKSGFKALKLNYRRKIQGQRLFRLCTHQQNKSLRRALDAIKHHNSFANKQVQIRLSAFKRVLLNIDIKVKSNLKTGLTQLLFFLNMKKHQSFVQQCAAQILFNKLKEESEKAQRSFFDALRKYRKRRSAFKQPLALVGVLKLLLIRQKAQSFASIRLYTEKYDQGGDTNRQRSQQRIEEIITSSSSKNILKLFANLIEMKARESLRHALNYIGKAGESSVYKKHAYAIVFAERMHGFGLTYRKFRLSQGLLALKAYSARRSQHDEVSLEPEVPRFRSASPDQQSIPEQIDSIQNSLAKKVNAVFSYTNEGKQGSSSKKVGSIRSQASPVHAVSKNTFVPPPPLKNLNDESNFQKQEEQQNVPGKIRSSQNSPRVQISNSPRGVQISNIKLNELREEEAPQQEEPEKIGKLRITKNKEFLENLRTEPKNNISNVYPDLKEQVSPIIYEEEEEECLTRRHQSPSLSREMQDQTEDFEEFNRNKKALPERERLEPKMNTENSKILNHSRNNEGISPSPIPRNSVDFKSRLITDTEDFMTNRDDLKRYDPGKPLETFQSPITPFSKKKSSDNHLPTQNLYKKDLYSKSIARPNEEEEELRITKTLNAPESKHHGKAKSLSIQKHNSLEINHFDSSYNRSPRENQIHSRSFQQIDLKNRRFNSFQNSMQLSCRGIDSARTDQIFPDSTSAIRENLAEHHQIRPFMASEEYYENEIVQYNSPSERNAAPKNQLKMMVSKGYKEERKLRKESQASVQDVLSSSKEILRNPLNGKNEDAEEEEPRPSRYNRISSSATNQARFRPPQLSPEALNLTSTQRSPQQTPTHTSNNSQYHSRKPSATVLHNSILSQKTIRSPKAADQDYLPEYGSSRSQHYAPSLQSDGSKRLLPSDNYRGGEEDPSSYHRQLPNHYFRPAYKSSMSENRYNDPERGMRVGSQNEGGPNYGPVHWISIPSPSNMNLGQQSFKFNVPKDKYSKQLYQSRQSQDLFNNSSKVLSQDYLRASTISTDINSPGSQFMSRMRNGSVMVPEQVFKIGIMVNILDKFNSLNRLKMLNQAFQTLNSHQQKFAFKLRQTLLRLTGIAKKRNYMLLTQAFKCLNEKYLFDSFLGYGVKISDLIKHNKLLALIKGKIPNLRTIRVFTM